MKGQDDLDREEDWEDLEDVEEVVRAHTQAGTL